MPIAPSWTDVRDAPAQVRALLVFRAGTLGPRGRRRAVATVAVLAAVTVVLVALAAYAPGINRSRAGDTLALLPTLCLGFLAVCALSAAVTGGGRELLPREQAVAFPVSTTTEYVGSVLLTPVNVAWILQLWTLLVAGGYAVSGHALVRTELTLLAWTLLATTFGQLIGWVLEAVRRGRHGRVIVNATGFVALVGLVLVVLTHHLAGVLDAMPTAPVLGTVLAALGGEALRWLGGVAALLAVALLAASAGVVAADRALRRPERAELRLESGRHRPRRDPATPWGAAVRIDRASVWRAVPLRRGLASLALLPGLLAVMGGVPWPSLALLPGLVASGAALLYGVNAWCLDGRGALWRESLPVAPRVAYWARAAVLAEVLLGSAAVTGIIGALRAGRPTPAALASLVCAALVVCVQVVGASLRWSVARPFHTDLRAARATPAPPAVMVGYSARLALVTTVTGLLFSTAARTPEWRAPVLLAVVMLAWSVGRLLLDARRWDDPAERARVITAVAG